MPGQDQADPRARPRRRSRFDDPCPARRPEYPAPTQAPAPPTPSQPPAWTLAPKVRELEGKEDLDSCRVGVMASALIALKARRPGRAPYAPIEDPADIPDVAPPPPRAPPSLVQRNRIEDFYAELDDLFERHRAEIDPDDPRYDYSRRRRFINKQLSVPVRIVTPEDMPNPVRREYHPPDAGADPADPFESFRRKRSSRYHVSYAMR